MSQDAIHNVVIGDQSYDVMRFDPERGLGIIARLAKIVGPAVAVGAVARGKAGDGDADALIDQTVVQAAQALSQSLDAPEVVRLVKDLLSVVVVVGKGKASDVFAMHFVGRYGDMFRLCAEVIKHNGFFDALGSLGLGLKP
jgi:hypothetical protein